MKRIVIVQRRMTHYRVPFFESLRNELASRGIELVVAYGQPTETELSKDDSGVLGWGCSLPNTYLFSGRICYQPIGSVLGGCDMLVVTHENKLLCNLWHQLRHTPYRVGLWGHGANLQDRSGGLRQFYKRVLGRHADWWFGYTEFSRPLIRQMGFPSSRVTIVNNAVDTSGLKRMRDDIGADSISEIRVELGLRADNVGIFIGSLYAEKRVEFMLQAAARLRKLVPDFELLILGGGPMREQVQKFCAANSWARYLGVQKGRCKVRALAVAKVMLNPGAVGLGILDSLACGVPMISVDCALHGPEVAYLQHGINGLLSFDSLPDYVRSVASVLLDQDLAGRLRTGCRMSASEYTIENMAKNFADGISSCLEMPSANLVTA